MKSTLSVQFVAFTFVVVALCASACNTPPSSSKPVVVIASPPSGSQYKQDDDVVVQSLSTDPSGVVRVQLIVDGSAIVLNYDAPSPSPSVPLAQTWKADPGTHTLTVRAYNAAGVASDPVAISIQVNPSVALNSPTPVGTIPVQSPTPAGPNPVLSPTLVGGASPTSLPTPAGGVPPTATAAPGAKPTGTITLGGVGPTRTPTRAPTVQLLPYMYNYFNKTNVNPTQSGQATVDCPSGTQVTDGGFAAADSFIIYRSEKHGNGWLVEAVNNTDSGGTKDLGVYAACVGNVTGTVSQVVQQGTVAGKPLKGNTPSGSASIACPPGTVLIGGGFAATPSLRVSYNGPLGPTVWEVIAGNNGVSQQTFSVSAMCYTGAGSSSSYVNQTISVGSSPGEPTVTCPPGTLPTGGGYQADGLNVVVSFIALYDQTSTKQPGWSFTAYNDEGGSKNFAAYAICTKF